MHLSCLSFPSIPSPPGWPEPPALACLVRVRHRSQACGTSKEYTCVSPAFPELEIWEERESIFKREDMRNALRGLLMRSPWRFLPGKVFETTLQNWHWDRILRGVKDLDSGSDDVPQLLRGLSFLQILMAAVTDPCTQRAFCARGQAQV